MAKSARQIRRLKALIARADAVASVAKAEWRKCIREIKKEVAYLTTRLDLAANADNREKVIRAVEVQINRLYKRLDNLDKSQLLYSSKVAHADAKDITHSGESVLRYDPKYANELVKLIREQGGGSMAATFTREMARTAVTKLRNVVVAAFTEHALAGGSTRELHNAIRDGWNAAVGNERNFRFVDRRGREWDTNTYIQMNVRTNSMKMYNEQIVRDFAKANDSDLVRISRDGRTDQHSCDACKFWAGRIVSITGKTKGFPTIADAEEAGMFHPNCIHTLEPISEEFDDEEIAEQKEQWKEDRRKIRRKRK